MNIHICVGSTCHINGSYDIMQLLKDAISEKNLEEQIQLSTAFCLGRCTDGVSVKLDDDIICGISKANFADFFETHVLSRI